MSNLKNEEYTKTNGQDARSKALLCFRFRNRNLNQELNGNLHYTFEININTFFLGKKRRSIVKFAMYSQDPLVHYLGIR